MSAAANSCQIELAHSEPSQVKPSAGRRSRAAASDDRSIVRHQHCPIRTGQRGPWPYHESLAELAGRNRNVLCELGLAYAFTSRLFSYLQGGRCSIRRETRASGLLQID